VTGGLDFPLRVTDRGAIRASGDLAALARAQLHQLLFTAPGERVDRPTFGCGIQHLVFGPADREQAAVTEYLIRTAVHRHLDRLIVLDAVRVTADGASLVVDVLYTLRDDGRELASTFTHAFVGGGAGAP
jgi:phage baseplate assembly protein W